MPPLPLDGIRVCELAWVWAGPFCGRLLADLGAEVIKVESTRRPDILRMIGPYAGEPAHYDRSGYFHQYNRNKLSVALDLSIERGREMVKALAAKSDIVTENFAAGVLKRLGLGYEVLRAAKPDLIMLSLSGYGQNGPESPYVSYGPAQVPLTGMASLTGYPGGPPRPLGVSYGDPVAGLHGAVVLLAALLHHRQTGAGQHIDLAQWEATDATIPEGLMAMLMNGVQLPRRGNRHDAWAPHGVYPCAGEDRWVALAVRDDAEWQALCRAMGAPELAADPRFQGGLARYHNQEALDARIGAWTSRYTPEEAAARLQAAGVPASPCMGTGDLFPDPHLNSRGFWVTQEQPDSGPRTLAGIATRLEGTPGAMRHPAPRLGEHNAYVYGEILGLSEAEIARLVEDGVVR